MIYYSMQIKMIFYSNWVGVAAITGVAVLTCTIQSEFFKKTPTNVLICVLSMAFGDK